MVKKHIPFSFINLIRLTGLTVLTAIIYALLKIQGKLRM